MDTAVQPIDDSDSLAWVTTSEDESSPERLPMRGDISNLTTTQQRWNGDPMDWESWPTGRPGPIVLKAKMKEAIKEFHYSDSERNESSRTEEKVFHAAEFSLTGQSEFGVYHNLV